MSESYRKKHENRQSADWLVDADGKPLGLIGPEGKVYQPVISEMGPGGGIGIKNILSLTQAQYDAIVTKDAATLYVIVEG